MEFQFTNAKRWGPHPDRDFTVPPVSIPGMGGFHDTFSIDYWLIGNHVLLYSIVLATDY